MYLLLDAFHPQDFIYSIFFDKTIVKSTLKMCRKPKQDIQDGYLPDAFLSILGKKYFPGDQTSDLSFHHW